MPADSAALISGDPFAAFATAGRPAVRLASWRQNSVRVASQSLSPTERARLAAMLPDTQRDDLAGTLGLRRLLVADLLEMPNAAIEITHEPAGQPRLVSPSGWSLSLSHKGAWTAAAVMPAPASIGIDVEVIFPIAWQPMLAMVCMESERRAFLDCYTDPETGLSAFLRLWTIKEAALKALGGGFRSGAKAVHVDVSALHSDGSGTLQTDGRRGQYWSVHDHERIISLVVLDIQAGLRNASDIGWAS